MRDRCTARQCAWVKLWSKGEDERCGRMAMADSMFCSRHRKHESDPIERVRRNLSSLALESQPAKA